MNIFLIGGTGLLGCDAARMFIEQGHKVKSIALPPVPEGVEIPEGMELTFGSYLDFSDDDYREFFKDCDCFIFAAGIDDRVELPPPIYDEYVKYNIKPIDRIMTIAKECGVKKAVILGSYFSYFAKKFPEMELTKKHPYIRSRIEQEKTALKFAEDGKMDVAVLELPYIFGTQPGRKPVWVILVEQIANMPKVTLYPKGGTTMVTVRQVSQAIVGAATKTKGGVAYPIGYYNLTWDELLKIVHEEMGFKNRKIIHIPKWMFKMYGKKLKKEYEEKNLEPGLNPIDLADIMCMEAFIDKKWSEMLGVTEDDIESAIRDSIALSVEAMKGKELIGMKAE